MPTPRLVAAAGTSCRRRYSPYPDALEPLASVLLRPIELEDPEKLDPLDFLPQLGCGARLVHWRTQTILTKSVHAVG